MRKIYVATDEIVRGDYLLEDQDGFIRKVDKELDPEEAKFLMDITKIILTEADDG